MASVKVKCCCGDCKYWQLSEMVEDLRIYWPFLRTSLAGKCTHKEADGDITAGTSFCRHADPIEQGDWMSRLGGIDGQDSNGEV